MKIDKLGVQLYTIRDFMATPEQFRESIRKLKDLGYDQGQTARLHIPYDMAECVELDMEERVVLYKLLYKLLSYVDKNEK